MITDIYFQIIGLFVSISILVVLIKQKKVGLLKERIILFSTILCILLNAFDILTRYFFKFNNHFSPFLISISGKLSLVFMVAEVILTSLYFLFDSVKKESQYKLIYLAILLSLVSGITVFVLNFQCIDNETFVSFSGLAFDVSFYLCWVFCLLLLVAIAILNKKMNFLHILASSIWLFVWLLGTIINFIFPNITCSSVSFAIALIVAMTLSENLESSFNIDLEIFQYDALITYLKLRYMSNKQLSLLYVYIFNEMNEYRKDVIINNIIDETIAQVKKKGSFRVFKTKSNELVICSSDAGQIDEASTMIKDFYDNYQKNLNFANRVDSCVVYVEDLHLADSPVDLINMLSSTKDQGSKDPLNTSIIRIDNVLVKKIKDEMQMVKEIDNAIENDGVELNYQPVYSINDGKIVSVEVLTRLKSMEGKTILPNEFIPVAEKYGRIVTLGEEILKKSCVFYTEMANKGVVLEDISVNFSSYQVEDTAIINSIIDAVSLNKLNPSCLCIEITNAHSVRKKSTYMRSVNKLVSFGVTLSLAGFGSDESNLDYIVSMPVNLIRLDRKFVWRSVDDEKAGLILDSIIEMVHSFGMKIVAVGVETKEQYETLCNKGVDYLQGIYISKPLSQKEFERFIESKEGDAK